MIRGCVFASFVAALCASIGMGCAPHAGASDVASLTTLRSAKIAPPVSVAAASLESTAPLAVTELPPVEWSSGWQGFGIPKCSYLAPQKSEDFIAADGAVDVVFHFHAGQMSEREMKQSGVRGVFVSCGYGMGTGGYSSAFEDPNRFGVMMKRLMWTLGQHAKTQTHLGRLALVSWSAGFASVSRILAVPEWYEATDTVVLLDSLHAQYIDTPISGGDNVPASAAQQGVDRVDTRGLKRFERFAADAVRGKKTMVITHSSIIPPDYASSTEATAALLADIGVVAEGIEKGSAHESDGPRLPHSNMALSVRADEGGLHVRGFRGMGPHDHFDHLHLIGEALRSWLVPRWYTPDANH